MATKTKAVKKPAPVAKPKAAKKEKGVIIAQAKVEFVSFTVRAVIPTQQYGNIQPEITVKAPTYEMARDFVMPHIEELYKTYGERPVNGNLPNFVGPVKETVKTVAPAPAPKAESPSSAPAPEVAAPSTTSSAAPEKPKSEAVKKAEKAISLAVSADAALAIQDQIEKSVKITAEEKPDLITLVLKKRNELK